MEIAQLSAERSEQFMERFASFGGFVEEFAGVSFETSPIDVFNDRDRARMLDAAAFIMAYHVFLYRLKERCGEPCAGMNFTTLNAENGFEYLVDWIAEYDTEKERVQL